MGLSAEGKEGRSSNSPAPGLEKDMSRRGTEKGLGELEGLLCSVHSVVNKTSGMKVWSFLVLTSGPVDSEFRRLRMAGTQAMLVAEC